MPKKSTDFFFSKEISPSISTSICLVVIRTTSSSHLIRLPHHSNYMLSPAFSYWKLLSFSTRCVYVLVFILCVPFLPKLKQNPHLRNLHVRFKNRGDVGAGSTQDLLPEVLWQMLPPLLSHVVPAFTPRTRRGRGVQSGRGSVEERRMGVWLHPSAFSSPESGGESTGDKGVLPTDMVPKRISSIASQMGQPCMGVLAMRANTFLKILFQFQHQSSMAFVPFVMAF